MPTSTIPSVLRSLLTVMQLDPDAVRGRLKAARKKAGLTQQEVADFLKHHKGVIENDEGRGAPSRVVLSRINDYAKLYNVPVESLLWGQEVIVHPQAQDLE